MTNASGYVSVKHTYTGTKTWYVNTVQAGGMARSQSVSFS